LTRVLEEQRRRFEILLVNDGSKNDCWEEIKRLADLDQRVRGINLSRNSASTTLSVVCDLLGTTFP
jgi:glycosyltransferase involved in cell wall biosynthesis